MLKGATFAIGITSGVYLGIYLRENGYSAGLTRAYYAYNNIDYGRKVAPKHKASLDEVYDLYNKGLLEGEQLDKFVKILNSKSYEKVDEVVISNIEDVFKDPVMAQLKTKYNNSLYEK